MRNSMPGPTPRMWFALAVFCGLAFPIPAQTSQAAMEHEFQSAMAAQQRGDLEQAKSILQALRRNHPGIFAIDESLGLVYVAQEKYAEALPFLQAAAREQPASDVAHANLGAALYRLHRNAPALAEFKRAAELNPKNSATQQSLGELWLDAGKPQTAVQALSIARKEREGDPNLELDYATALIAADDLEQAQQVLSNLPGADESSGALELSGEIDEKRGDFQNAVNHFERAAHLDASEANLWMLGVEFLRHWTFDAAIHEFEAAARKYPSSTRIKLGLGTAYFGDAKYAEAIPVFADLMNSSKNNALYAELLGMACTTVSDSARQKCSALITYAQGHPRDAKASTYAASMLLTGAASDARSELGRKLLSQALATDPKLPDAQYLMGVVRQNEGDWAGSVANLKAAVAVKPDLARAHYRLMLAYWRTGHKQEAQLESALQKKYSQQDLDRRLRQVTTFVVDVRN